MASATVGAVIMIGALRGSPQELLVDRALRASAIELAAALQRQGFHPIVLAGPDLTWVPDTLDVIRDEDTGAFHFGRRLASIIDRYGLSPVAYFGAGSAPFLKEDTLEEIRCVLAEAESERIPVRCAVTNNLHSSDWVGISHAQDSLTIIRRADRDNSLAWMQQESHGYSVRVLLGARPSSGMDLDTPTDLAVVRAHPLCPVRLSGLLSDTALDRIPVTRVVDVMAQDGSRVALIGRVSPLAWQALSSATQAWIRVFSEERGMAASERLARGDVRSLIGRLVDIVGPAGFFEELARIVDVALIDSRVMMAASGHYPCAADRFASDLFLIEAINDEWLRAFTAAASTAPIPVLLGGHGVVAGGLYAMVDMVEERRCSG